MPKKQQLSKEEIEFGSQQYKENLLEKQGQYSKLLDEDKIKKKTLQQKKTELIKRKETNEYPFYYCARAKIYDIQSGIVD
jgi:hypothetical protein